MKIAVFGSTGGTGKELVKQALDQGHDVVAYARNPEKLKDLNHEKLKIVQGDILDPVAVESAVEGQDAVLSTIGAGAKRTNLREEGTRVIIEAMQKAGIRRFICQSSFGVGDSRKDLPFFTRYIIVGIFLRHAFADHERQEPLIKKSNLEWTIVRPPYLTHGVLTGNYQHGLTWSGMKNKSKISRADVADFMLKQLTNTTYLHQTPWVSY